MQNFFEITKVLRNRLLKYKLRVYKKQIKTTLDFSAMENHFHIYSISILRARKSSLRKSSFSKIIKAFKWLIFRLSMLTLSIAAILLFFSFSENIETPDLYFVFSAVAIQPGMIT